MTPRLPTPPPVKARKGQGRQVWGWAAAVCSCWFPKGKFVGTGGAVPWCWVRGVSPCADCGPLSTLPVSKGHVYKGWFPRPGSTLFLGAGLPCWGGFGWGSWHLAWRIRFWLMEGPPCPAHLHLWRPHFPLAGCHGAGEVTSPEGRKHPWPHPAPAVTFLCLLLSCNSDKRILPERRQGGTCRSCFFPADQPLGDSAPLLK